MGMTDKEVLQLLGNGFSIRRNYDDSYELVKLEGDILHEQLQRLLKREYLIGFANGNGFGISDAGTCALIRSEDEMGNGELP